MQLKSLKKIFSAGTAALICVSLAACGNSAPAGASATSSAKAEAVTEAPAEAENPETADAPAGTEETPAGTEKASGTEAAGNTEKEAGASALYPDDSGEVIVFAAASMTETLEEIEDMYKEAAPGVTLTFNFDSSGTLVTQIEEGADCDLFISAAQKQMNEIDGTKDKDVNPEGYDLIDAGTRTDILENKVVLVVPADNLKELKDFDDLAAHFEAGDILMAMGNEDVPVGQYTQKVLDYYGLDEAALAEAGLITYGSNVKEVTTQVAEGSVDCGVIYCTDAFSAGLDIIDEATPEMCGQVIYPAAVMKNAPNASAAQHFLDYIRTPEAMKVFEAVGFSKVG